MVDEPGTDVDPLDLHHDPRRVARLRMLAAEVATGHGGDLGRMRRANGLSNATWVGDGIAVRITRLPADMSREVALVRALPRGVGHPEILDAGTIEGHGWIVTRKVGGQNLQEAWPTLTPTQRRQALLELWARAEAVHDASASLTAHVASHGGFVPPTVGDALARAARAETALGLARAQTSRLHGLIQGFFRLAPTVERTVNHGDLALMNALWDGRVRALLDFEFAVLGPVEIDLCRLVLEAHVSGTGRGADEGAGAAAAEIAAQRMHPVHGRGLIHGAAVLDQLRDVDLWLAPHRAEPVAEEGGGDWRPDRLLAGLLEADGGYLASVLK